MLRGSGEDADEPDKENDAPRGRGRPPGAKNKKTIAQIKLREARELSVRNRREKRERDQRDSFGPATRTRQSDEFGFSPTQALPPPPLPLANNGKRLTQDQTNMAVRVVCVCKNHAIELEQMTPIDKATFLTGVGKTKLKELYAEYKDLRGSSLPEAKIGMCTTRRSAIPRSLIPDIKEFVHNRRVVEGKVVEVPDVLMYLRRQHGIEISRKAAQRSMNRYGFRWGRTTRLCVRRELARVVRKRNIYLKRNRDIDEEIAQRDAELADPHFIGPKRRRLVKVYIDESYVNVNHSLGYSWYHITDDLGNARNLPSGKGRRLVLLGGILADGLIGVKRDAEIPEHFLKPDEAAAAVASILPGMMIFEARKCSGDYHANMDSTMFLRWVREQLVPQLDALDVDAVLVMDNAGYHCTPAEGCVDPASWKNKGEAQEWMQKYSIPFREGRAPLGDSLEQLRAIASAWLKENAQKHNIKTKHLAVKDVLGPRHRILFTPPYMPELQPIEELWRSVKGFVAREFAGTRSICELWLHVLRGFVKYGTAEHTRRLIERAKKWEERYWKNEVYGVEAAGDVIDLTVDTDDEDVAEAGVDAEMLSSDDEDDV